MVFDPTSKQRIIGSFAASNEKTLFILVFFVVSETYGIPLNPEQTDDLPAGF